MFSSELYKKYIEVANERYSLENKINDYIEKWKNGETVLSTKSVEQAIEKGYERLEDLKKIEESIHQDFVNEMNPKYSIISVGKNNRYGHPNKEVLNTLEDSKIYRTDQDGSIMFKIKNNRLKIENCSP